MASSTHPHRISTYQGSQHTQRCLLRKPTLTHTVKHRHLVVPRASTLDGGVKHTVSLTSIEEYEAFIASNTLSVVKFKTAWCGVCKMIGPKAEKLAAEMAETHPEVSFQWGEVDMGELPGAGTLYKDLAIKNLPTFHMYKKGEKVGEYVGGNIVNLRKLVFCFV